MSTSSGCLASSRGRWGYYLNATRPSMSSAPWWWKRTRQTIACPRGAPVRYGLIANLVGLAATHKPAKTPLWMGNLSLRTDSWSMLRPCCRRLTIQIARFSRSFSFFNHAVNVSLSFGKKVLAKACHCIGIGLSQRVRPAPS